MAVGVIEALEACQVHREASRVVALFCYSGHLWSGTLARCGVWCFTAEAVHATSGHANSQLSSLVLCWISCTLLTTFAL